MTDEANNGAPSALASWNVRIIFGSIVLGFCMALIAYTMLLGKSDNSLHQSALSWSFALILAILFGFGVGANIDSVMALATGKKS